MCFQSKNQTGWQQRESEKKSTLKIKPKPQYCVSCLSVVFCASENFKIIQRLTHNIVFHSKKKWVCEGKSSILIDSSQNMNCELKSNKCVFIIFKRLHWLWIGAFVRAEFHSFFARFVFNIWTCFSIKRIFFHLLLNE